MEYLELVELSNYGNTDGYRNLMIDLGWKEKGLPVSQERRRNAAVFWCVQDDAAAGVEAEATVDSGGGALEVEQRKEDDAKRHEGEKVKMTPRSYL